MNFSVIRYVLGYVLKIEGLLLLIPALVGAGYREKECYSFFVFSLVTLVIGGVMSFKKPKNQVFYAKEGFVSVALSWIMMSFFGCLPFVMNEDIPRFVDAFFETVSGFTTTGSSILSDVEALSHCSLFWRSFTHWVGGMGVLVFILTVMPMAGGAAMHLMRAESPGPQVGKMVPKLRETSIILYVIYAAMTVLEFIVLLCCGMETFDAVNIAFGTAGTGGFAIKNAGVAVYSPACQYVIGVFMILFGVNFNVYYLVLIGKLRQALKSEEARCYLLVIALAVGAITVNTAYMYTASEEAFRHAFFQVGSIITTTGFATTNFDLYPDFSKEILLLLMFIGACAGSTGGGIKVSRIIILLKSARNELAKLVHPRTIKQIRLDGKSIDTQTTRSVHTFIAAYGAVFVLSLLLISLDDFSMTTNFSAVAATINNIGPGFARVGATGNFGAFSDFSKYVFCFDMLAGRLELFPMLVLFSPYTWSQALRRKRHR